MRQTVLGVYDSYEDACSAQRALAEVGVAQADIAVYSLSVDAPAEKGPRVYAPGSGGVPRHQPVFDQLEHLFARLFKRGEYPPETEDYREFIRRGGALVSADVSEMQVDLARDAMRRTGAADIEDRSKEWRNGATPQAGRDDAASASSPPSLSSSPSSSGDSLAATEARQQAGSSADQSMNTVGGMQQVTTRPRTGETNSSPASQPSLSDSASDAGLSGDPILGAPLDDDPYDTEYRKDYDANYAGTGTSFDEYRTAYRHGATLGQDERYSGDDWQRVESSARDDWESRYPESGWERFKAAVRHGWERVTGHADHTGR
jgi:hypothetical protein